MSPRGGSGPDSGIFAGMSQSASRYRMDACLLEIASLRDRLGLQDKDIFMSIGMEQGTFSRKMAGVRRFTVEELGQIADFFGEQTNRQLPGWPLLPEALCLVIETHLYPAAERPPEG